VQMRRTVRRRTRGDTAKTAGGGRLASRHAGELDGLGLRAPAGLRSREAVSLAVSHTDAHRSAARSAHGSTSDCVLIPEGPSTRRVRHRWRHCRTDRLLMLEASRAATARPAYSRRRLRQIPASGNTSVLTAMSHALAADAARARMSSVARRWMAAARSGYSTPSRNANAVATSGSVAGFIAAIASMSAPRAANRICAGADVLTRGNRDASAHPHASAAVNEATSTVTIAGP
jgi:hypothetical protein